MNIGLEGLAARLEAAMEAGKIAWWEMELPSGVVFFSENKARMLARDPGDFVHYKNFTDLLHPEDYEQAMDAMRMHLSGEAELYSTFYRIRAADGTYRMFFDRGKIVGRSKQGEVKVAGVVMDITDDLEALSTLKNR